LIEKLNNWFISSIKAISKDSVYKIEKSNARRFVSKSFGFAALKQIDDFLLSKSRADSSTKDCE